MKLRFEFQGLSQLGEGVHRLPVRCWRLTMNFTSPSGTEWLLEGHDNTQNLNTDAALNTAAGRFVVGGVMLPDGTPLNLDQMLTLSVSAGGGLARGFLIYEYLEP